MKNDLIVTRINSEIHSKTQVSKDFGFDDLNDVLEIGNYDYVLNDMFSNLYNIDSSPYQMSEAFYMAQEKRRASIINLNDIRLKPLMKAFKGLGVVELIESRHSYSGMPLSFMLNIEPAINSKIKHRIIVSVGILDSLEIEKYPEYKADVLHLEGKDCIPFVIDQKVLFHPDDSKFLLEFFGKISEDFGVGLHDEDPHIEMIIQTSSGLTTRRIKFDLDYSDDLDLHYGAGFSTFHTQLVERIGSRDKGIAMFYGPPGTGKTHYIRRLLPELSKAGKRAILIPKHVLGAIESPAFNEFMLTNFIGQKIVFVIEDSESIISKRSSNGGARSEVVSTLLNITDGILNDIFSIQVILTFNTELKLIDEALLRKGRLIAKYKFEDLSNSDSKKLADHLGFDSSKLKDRNNLAEIYALGETDEDEVLINNNLPDKEKVISGF